MLRNAIVGSAVCLGVIAVVLLALGFRPAHLAQWAATPFPRALEEGACVEKPVLSTQPSEDGRFRFGMTVENPAPRPLVFRGDWDGRERGGDTGATTRGVVPGSVHTTIAPGESSTISFEVRMPDGTESITPAEFTPPVFTGELALEAEDGGEAEVHPFSTTLGLHKPFGTTNAVTVGIYMAVLLVIGLWSGTHVKSVRGYFTAEGKLNYVVVALSILGTYLSALSVMGLPAMSYGVHDWTYVIQLPCLLITAMVITGVVLPRYRAAGIVSVYEYLEQRIGPAARLAASASFIIFAVGRMGLLLYLPGLALATATGLPLVHCILLMGVIVTAYTVVGGIEAVVWTDALQAVVFIVGALVILTTIISDLGADRFMAIASEHDKFRRSIPEFDVFKITTAWLVLETIFQTIRIYGVQQDVAQRYMTTESTEKANRSAWIGILSYIPVAFIFYLIGTALFAWFQAHPDPNIPERHDRILPYYVVTQLPPGVAGLVIAAIFAAAMSSIDSAMNSATTVCIEDFLKRFGKRERTDAEWLRLARRLTLGWGLLGITAGLLFMQISYAQILWGKLMGITTNGILGLLALALLPVRINGWAAMAGFAVSYACLFIMMASGINFLLWPVVGNTVCFLVALFLNPLYAGKDGDAAAPSEP